MFLKNRIFRWCLVLLFWSLIGLIFGTQLHTYMSRSNYPISWASVLIWEGLRWSLWAFLSPLIFLLCRKFPIQPNRKIQRILFHLAASLAVSFLHLVLFATLYWLQTKFATSLSVSKPFSTDFFIIFHSTFTLTFHVGVLVYWGILLGYEAIENSRRASLLEAQLAQAELGALKMQLHPHFLFNTLNSISALLHQDPEAADEMIGELGDFLRLTLKNPGAQEVSLQEELKFLRSYLEIERVRLQNRLTAKFDVDAETLDAQLPNLILQPLIENAIRYAIAPRTAPGRIEIRTRKKNGRLEIEVLDDGPGFSEDSNVITNSTGIGLSNTRARLKQMYGSKQDFQLKNRPEGGLSIHIEIPFKILPNEESENREEVT